MKTRAVFLDRDGTINVEKNYLYKAEEFEYLPGVIEGLQRLQKAGFCLIIVTNQSGIARGYYTEADFLKLNAWLISDLEKSDIHITKTYFCPHHPEAEIEAYKKNCDCRKPKRGLFIQAAQDYDIDLSQSYAIGDKYRDLTLCNTEFGTQGYLIYTQPKEEGSIHCIEGGLNEAAQYIVEREYGKLD